ncbi:serine hydrolase domain-containing protein [Metabacillus iocasae]|uniref:CubicO group peptidase (Beta-lactamase class C family) n=1 Tax=Priestia iocasae TaxID=2291674 RepID=A0ABS2QVC1_9BACI|nr:serine hydrolase domain-containing protein [Metabacillus iocasae]MBM7702937.1 CubicO group peptidase (beta-lactamase class C family) [Metabacillus iocasae]
MNVQFDSVSSQVKGTSEFVNCSGAALYIIHNDEVVVEKYWGKHSKDPHSRSIQADTQFHVASVRKSYIGFAVAYAVRNGFISSIDTPVADYFPLMDPHILDTTTIRHLLTHTHGLRSIDGQMVREFPPGSSWAYRGIGVEMLTQLVKKATNQSVAQILAELVFKPLHFTESEWCGKTHEKLVDVIRKPDDPSWATSKSTDGDKMNMYVSARELAKWGYLHLQKGNVNGKQQIPPELFKLATRLQSPSLVDKELPQNGYLWFVKDWPAAKSEIGELVPKGSFQILGYTGVTLLVIPTYKLVAVRAFNSFGSPEGFDYLADVREFGDTIMKCLLNE